VESEKRCVLGEWSATLTLPDYGRVARNSGRTTMDISFAMMTMLRKRGGDR
jgi:hypothetical protein